MRLYNLVYYSLISIFAFSTAFAANFKQKTFKVQVESGSVSVTMSLPDVSLSDVVVEGKSYQSINIESDGLIGVPGSPAVPSWSRLIEIPSGSIPTVEISYSGESTIDNFDLAPLPTPNDNPNIDEIIPISTSAYQLDSSIPEHPASISDIITIGNRQYALLDVTPYSYNPARRELTIINDLNVELKFDAQNDDRENDGADNKFRAQVWNELDDAISQNPPERDESDSRTDILGHYVIVHADHDDLAETLQPLVEWKERKGYKVTVVNMGDLGRGANDLKEYLQDAYDEWEIPPTFVVLTGDVTGVTALPYYSDNAAPTNSWASTDQEYALWDGIDNDRDPEMWIPEGFVGRLPARSVAELEIQVDKIIGYEAVPYIDEPWVEGAVLIAHGVRSCQHANVAVREIMEHNGFATRDILEAYADYHAGQAPNRNAINDRVDEGVGFVNFRGYDNWGNYWSSIGEIRGRRNGRMMPVVTGMVCGTNDFPNRYKAPESIGEAWMRTSGNPAGAIATFGPTDIYTHTWFNNPMDAEFYHVLFNKGVHTLGVAALASKISLLRNYPSLRNLGNGLSSGYYFYTYNLLGDPGLQIWTKDPMPMTIEFNQELPRGTTSLNIVVLNDDENPVEGAYVHIFRKHDDGEDRFGAYSNSDGMVAFTLDPMEAGEYSLTVTAPNMVPVMESFDVVAPSLFASVSGYSVDDNNNDDSNGNGDETVNPGETIELGVVLYNSGENMFDASSVSISSPSEWVEIVRETVDYPSIDAEEDAEGEQPFVFRCLPGTPNGATLKLDFAIVAEENSWEGSLVIPVVGYDFDLVEFEFDEALYPGTEQELFIIVENVGELDSDDLTATLSCDNLNIQIRQADSPLGELAVGEGNHNQNQPFLVYANPSSYQGSEVTFYVDVHDETGRSETLSTTVLLGEPTVDAPQGPDKYGYWAFDNRDEDSGMAPEYEWVAGRSEINGLVDHQDFPNYNSDHGSSTQLDLPFNFMYYGEEFSEITVGSNGWMCFGETDQIAWNNQELGSPLGPPGMICPFWTDMWDGSVYTYDDEDNSRFIIEWRGYNSADGNNVTFAVQLYDPTVINTATGDGEIYFVYNSLPGLRVAYEQEQATIGISSPDRNDGLLITHARYWDPRTAELDDEMTIRFSTGEITTVGSVSGTVSDITDDSPLQNVRVMIEGTGFFSNTNADGEYRIERIPIGSYTLTAVRRHFNSAIAADVEIGQDEDVETNFELTHPTFNIDIEGFEIGIEPDSIAEEGFSIWNEGNGPLDYSLILETDGRYDPWNAQFDFNASAQTETNDRFLRGMTYDGDLFYVAGRVGRNVYPHKIYLFNHDGELIGDVDQYTVDSSAANGYNELEWNGENLFVAERGNILEITREGEFIRIVTETDETEIQNIAWSPSRETIFAKPRLGNQISEFDVDGNLVDTYSFGDIENRCLGLGWFPVDPDGYNLYIFTELDNIEEHGTRIELHKMDPTTGDIQLVTYIVQEEGDKPQGCVITKQWDPNLWTLVGLVNNPTGDRIVGWELAPNFTWISYDPAEGSIQPDDSQQFMINIMPEDLPNGDYFVDMQLFHNAVGDMFEIPLLLNIGPQAISGGISNTPTEFTFNSPYPNPFNPSTKLEFGLPNSASVELTVWDINGRLVESLNLGQLNAGQHRLHYEAGALAGGIYIAKLSAGQHSVSQKLVLMK